MNKCQFQCPACGQFYEGSVSNVGLDFKCLACGQTFRLEEDNLNAVPTQPSGLSWYIGIFQKYFRFQGRARRREFFWAYFFQTIAMTTFCIVDSVVGANNRIVFVFALFAACPMFAVTCRRLHDTNKSAWWFFLQIVPVLNLAYIAWLLTNGDAGSNRFGPDPKQTL